MEKEEFMNEIGELRNKFKFNGRQFFMICVLLFATAVDVLMDYVQAGFNPAIFQDPSYWIILSLTCLSVILVTLTVRDFFREKELTSNSKVMGIQAKIDSAHAELVKHNLVTRFENYVNGINAERKLKAYKSYLQFKLFKAKGSKKSYWQNLLNSADKDISFLPTAGKHIRLTPVTWVRYNRVSISTIFVRSGKLKNDDDDLESNEGAHVRELLFKKLFPIIAFSITLSTLFFDTGTFALGILIKTFSKFFRIVMCGYAGATDGSEFVKVTLLSKMEHRLDFIQKFLEREKALLNEKDEG